MVSVLLVELSSEEVLLDKAWSAGRLLVSSSICREQDTGKSRVIIPTHLPTYLVWNYFFLPLFILPLLCLLCLVFASDALQ